MKKQKTNKFSLKEKVALAVFMESVPKLIEQWQNRASEKPFDVYLMDIWTEHKEREMARKNVPK